MEVYTPEFNKIKSLIKENILNFIGKRLVASSRKINEYILNLKEEKLQEDEDFNLIDFTFSSPYSSQVDDLLFDLVRRCIIKEGENGYKLTNHGKRLIGIEL